MIQTDGTTMTVWRDCVVCKQQVTIEIPVAELKAIEEGTLYIQDAAPSISADAREMFLSGICPVCWDKTFAEEEE